MGKRKSRKVAEAPSCNASGSTVAIEFPNAADTGIWTQATVPCRDLPPAQQQALQTFVDRCYDLDHQLAGAIALAGRVLEGAKLLQLVDFDEAKQHASLAPCTEVANAVAIQTANGATPVQRDALELLRAIREARAFAAAGDLGKAVCAGFEIATLCERIRTRPAEPLVVEAKKSRQGSSRGSATSSQSRAEEKARNKARAKAIYADYLAQHPGNTKGAIRRVMSEMRTGRSTAYKYVNE